jgi:hypothetical protein
MPKRSQLIDKTLLTIVTRKCSEQQFHTDLCVGFALLFFKTLFYGNLTPLERLLCVASASKCKMTRLIKATPGRGDFSHWRIFLKTCKALILQGFAYVFQILRTFFDILAKKVNPCMHASEIRLLLV